jgi:hypothetical protein
LKSIVFSLVALLLASIVADTTSRWLPWGLHSPAHSAFAKCPSRCLFGLPSVHIDRRPSVSGTKILLTNDDSMSCLIHRFCSGGSRERCRVEPYPQCFAWKCRPMQRRSRISSLYVASSKLRSLTQPNGPTGNLLPIRRPPAFSGRQLFGRPSPHLTFKSHLLP